MPELPEVETIRCQVEDRLVGQRIKKVWLRKSSLVFRDFKGKNRLPKTIEGKKVNAVKRRGKYLLIELEGGLTLMIHLGMSGNLIVSEGAGGRDRHCHLEIFFKDFRMTLRDPRMFGRVALFKNRDFSSLPGLDALGPEPLSKDFNAEWLSRKFKGRKAPVKALLLDQKIGAGIGNIYSDEACHVSRISPLRPAGKIKKEEIEKLSKAVKKVLNRAIEDMGCTIRDYKTSEGVGGDYQPLVYGRRGQRCLRCGGTIIRARVGSRSSFYCPECQEY